MKLSQLNFFEKAICILTAGILLSSSGFAGEKLEISGTFTGTDIPDGWAPNKPNSWDDAGSVRLAKVLGIDKNSLQLNSDKKKMHVFTRKAFPVTKGNVVVLKAMVKGQGNVFLGLYAYPGGWQLGKEIKTSKEWTEVVSEIEISTDKIKDVRIVVGAVPGASVEIMDLTASIESGEQERSK